MTEQLMNPYFLLFASTFIVNIFLLFLIVVRRRNSSSIMFWFFALMILSCIWAFIQLMVSVTAGVSFVMWYSVMELIIVLILPVYFCFVLSYVGREHTLRSIPVLFMVMIPASVLLFLYWKTDYVNIHDFSQALSTPWGYQFPRKPIPWDIFIIGVYCLAAVVELIWYLATVKDQMRKRATVFILIAFLVPIIGGMVFQGIIPAIYNTAEFPAAAPLLLVTCVVIGYVLIRYGKDVFDYKNLSLDIVSSIPTPLLVLDESQKIQIVNTAFTSLVKQKQEALLGKEFMSLISDDTDKAQWKKMVFDPLQTNNMIENVSIHNFKIENQVVSVNIHATVKRNPDSSIKATILLFTDNSVIQLKAKEIEESLKHQQEQATIQEENKRAMLNLLEDSRVLEEDLKIERDRANAIVSSMTEGLFVVDKNYKIVLMNPMAGKLLGLEMKAVIGQDFGTITHAYKGSKVVPTEARPLIQTMKTGIPSAVGLEDDYAFKTSTGVMVPVSLSTVALRRGEEVIGGLVTFHDISRDKQVKETIEQTVEERTLQLKEEQARLTSSINSLEMGFILTDIDGGIISKNPAASSLLNLPWGTKGLADMDAAMKASFALVDLHNKARNEHKPVEKRNVTLGGKNIDVFVAPIYIGGRDEDFIGSVLLIQDQTESRVLERSRDEFFSIASHELRTPLTAIRGNTSLIQEHYSEGLDPELKEMINDVHESSVRLIDIVNDFLNMGRLEQQRVTFKNESFVMEDLIHSALKEYEVTGSRQHLSLEFIEPSKPMPRVFADKERTRQVIVNLIGNAIKFTTVGGVKISVRENDNMVELSISDTGRGIALNNQALLFHKFQQAGDSLFTRDTTKGTGLGLYISKLMIEGMGGKIWLVNSEEGKGTTFAFTIPLAKAGLL
jgi:PAS domain S-box-containing protein